MRDKIKIVIEPTPIEPDLPPFICDVCGAETPYWLIKHSGKYKMCTMHTRKNSPVPARSRHEYNYSDYLQMDAIHSVIGAIQNERR